MEIARIEVGRTTGTCTRRGRIPAGIVGASVQVSFTDPVWDNLIKTVVFRGKETRIAEFDGTVAVIPHEAVAAEGVTLFFGIFGHAPDTDLQIPLIEVRLGTTEKATDANADPGTDPTLPIWAQLKQDVEQLKQSGGIPGPPGGPGPEGEDGEDGGWYMPAVKQLDEDTIQFTFTPSKTGMTDVEPVTVELPYGQGSGGNVDLTGYATEQWVQDQKYLTAVPDGYAKTDEVDPKGTATSAVSQHNTADDSHNDIRLELKALSDRLTAFFDSDDKTLDELSEIVAYITSNKSLIDAITTSKVSVADIIDNLTTNVSNKPLSAAQGVVLKGLIDTLFGNLANYQPKGDYALQSDIPTVPSKVSAFTNDAGYLTEHQDISGKADQTEVDSLTSNQTALSARMDTFTKLGEGSTTGDAELMDARVDCEGNTWNNVGGHIRGITDKIIDACCDKEIIEGGNYNLLKVSEVSFKSRLQDDVAGITNSNTGNIVTGWISVKYGKLYTPSILLNGNRIAWAGQVTNSLVVRMNLKLSDGSIIVYKNADLNANVLLAAKSNETVRILHENAVAMMLHVSINGNDISTADKLKAFEPMIVEVDTEEEARTTALTMEYIDGDTVVPSGVVYTLKHDETKVDKVNSPYVRNVNFGVLPSTYYKGLSEDYASEGFNVSTQYADYIARWKSLVAGHGSYVTETALGTASDGQTVYLYDFKPVRIPNQNKPIPKVIIIAGQHGGETCNIFGLYYFISNLLMKWNQHPALEYLRNHVELMIVPVLNTYGFDNQSYKNANGVNINRNYDSNWTLLEDATSDQYGGAEPFDQPETQIVRDLLLNNADVLMVIDSHVNGGGMVDDYSESIIMVSARVPTIISIAWWMLWHTICLQSAQTSTLTMNWDSLMQLWAS